MVSDCWLGCLGGGGHWVTGFTESEHMGGACKKKMWKGTDSELVKSVRGTEAHPATSDLPERSSRP